MADVRISEDKRDSCQPFSSVLSTSSDGLVWITPSQLSYMLYIFIVLC